MSLAGSIQALKAFKKQGVWFAAGLGALVAIGAVGRDDSDGRNPEDGYSVVDLKTAVESEAGIGYVPVQMHQPGIRRFQSVKELADDRKDSDRYERKSSSDDLAPVQIQQAAMEDEDEDPSRKNRRSKDKDKNDMFSSLRNKDDQASGMERTDGLDDSLSWGWLADGVAERERADAGRLEQREPSAMETTLRNDLWSGGGLGGTEPAESSAGGKSFGWGTIGTETTP